MPSSLTAKSRPQFVDRQMKSALENFAGCRVEVVLDGHGVDWLHFRDLQKDAFAVGEELGGFDGHCVAALLGGIFDGPILGAVGGAPFVIPLLGGPAFDVLGDFFVERGAEGEADALIRLMESLTRSETNVSSYKMQIIRPGDNRELRLKTWDDRVGSKSFIHILSPRRDANTTFLKVEGNLWMYLPRLERDIKIPPAMMLNSWMGSDFTNDDLARESSLLQDYTHKLIGINLQILQEP